MKRATFDTGQDPLPQVLQIAGIGVWELFSAPGGMRVRLSPAVYALFGYEEGEMRGSWEQVVEKACHPDYRAGLRRCVDNAVARPGETFHFEFLAWSKTRNEWHWVYAFGKTLPMDDSGGVHLLGGVQDIHERRAAQKTLERSQQEALQTVELQKVVLEQQVQEQTTLLRTIQERVDSILGATSPMETDGRPHVADATRDVYDAVDMLFAESLHNAFDIITGKMAWYKAVIDSIPFPIAVSDLDGRWMYLNTPGLSAAGATSLQDLYGLPAKNWSTLGERVESQDGCQTLFSLHHKELGRFFQGQGSGLFDNNGDLIGHIETMQDVTEVHEADERTRFMLDAMPFGCYFWDKNLRLIDCNRAAISLFGLDNKKDYIKGYDKLSPEFQPCGRKSAELSREHIRKAFDAGYNRFEWEHRTVSGEPLPCEVTLVRILWRDDYVVVGCTADLRELKAARLELDKERLLLKEILDSSPVCMLILVGDKVRFSTPFTRDFLGISVGDSMHSFHADPFEATLLEEELRRNRALNWRPVTVKSASNGVRDMLGNAFFTEYYGEEGLVVWLVDVTEMREKERQLLQARDAAEESTRAKSEFLANMSHEIRTPMNAILGMTHLIQRTELTPKQRDYMNKAEQSSKALLRIINDILDFSKIEAGKLEMERLPFSVENVMRDVLAVLSETAREKGLELLLAIPRELPLTVEGDPLRLHQVLLNLASNAVKFTAKGNVTLGVSVLRAAEDGVVLGFGVSDTGIGMTQAQISVLFSPFTQADTSTTRQYGGTGLGLAICKRLVELMDGAIWCESLPGAGSTFRFTARFGMVEAAPLHSAGHFANLKVLLVGDNAEAITLLRPMLQAMGCRVSTAYALERAVELLRRPDGFDLLVMDWRNVAIHAPQALAYLKGKTGGKLPPSLLAIPEADADALDASAKPDITAPLSRPVTPSGLFNAINGLIRATPELAGDPAARAKHAETGLENLAPFKGAKILLVEDNAINQMVGRELLEIAGLDADIADNGREALQKVRSGGYDLVLMDIQMPEMDGFTAARAIRDLGGFDSLPIIAMTALAMQGDREKSLDAGMNDHVTKPIDASELYRTLARWLGK